MDGHWVFGGIERVSGEYFFVEVQQRDANTLLPLIAQFIRPGSIVYSDDDEWSSYNLHLTVNHSLYFGGTYARSRSNVELFQAYVTRGKDHALQTVYNLPARVHVGWRPYNSIHNRLMSATSVNYLLIRFDCIGQGGVLKLTGGGGGGG